MCRWIRGTRESGWRFMLEDSAPAALLTEAGLKGLFAGLTRSIAVTTSKTAELAGGAAGEESRTRGERRSIWLM